MTTAGATKIGILGGTSTTHETMMLAAVMETTTTIRDTPAATTAAGTTKAIAIGTKMVVDIAGMIAARTTVDAPTLEMGALGPAGTTHLAATALDLLA